MLGQRRNLLLAQCWTVVYDAGPTLIHHWVCCILCANTWHSPNAVLMLTHNLRRWPDIETAWGDAFGPAPETPDNTTHWPNADVMLGHCLRRWANIIPVKTL